MQDFFRFPRTPHIAWLGDDEPRDDKVLSQQEAKTILDETVTVEEKLDGANLGLSLSANGEILVQNRGQYIARPFTGQFSRLAAWLGIHQTAVAAKLNSSLILFGEWCAAKHSIKYENLPDLFLLFDVYDRKSQKFWSTNRRNALADSIGLSVVPQLTSGLFTLFELKALLKTYSSDYREGPPEGIVIRRDSAEWCEARAKLVRAEFTQSISEHWRRKTIVWNGVKQRMAIKTN